MRNNSTVINLKVQLIQEFHRMKAFIKEKQTEEWQESRNQSKICNRKMTDTIQIFVEYAESNGSSKPNMYYLHFQKLINKALSIKANERDFIGQQELNGQAFVMNFLEKEIISGIKKKLNYKEVYLQCKEKVEYFVSCFGLKLK